MIPTKPENLPKCPSCGGPPQRCGSTYYPRYTVHCLRCGRTTEVFSNPLDADTRWKDLSKNNY